jgi:hypothetical protein
MNRGFFGHPETSPEGPPTPQSTREETPSERVVRILEGWFNQALDQPEGTYPRIPLRASREGGWDTVLTTDSGRAWADAWWANTFAGIDIDR